ncbi:hypothetical protein WQO_23300 [Streptomyces globisporus C-1027]|uniref:Uncharacterized protein n=1 Tax=Streptomyces globisporus C-1027 TaxID=1172567 RepID=A0A0U3LZJ9_STRGL|nr:hypothetical protein WQO_23300 [Streptomyces globisporus C-1027]
MGLAFHAPELDRARLHEHLGGALVAEDRSSLYSGHDDLAQLLTLPLCNREPHPPRASEKIGGDGTTGPHRTTVGSYSVAEIYTYYVRHTVITFEENPPPVA